MEAEEQSKQGKPRINKWRWTSKKPDRAKAKRRAKRREKENKYLFRWSALYLIQLYYSLVESQQTSSWWNRVWIITVTSKLWQLSFKGLYSLKISSGLLMAPPMCYPMNFSTELIRFCSNNSLQFSKLCKYNIM